MRTRIEICYFLGKEGRKDLLFSWQLAILATCLSQKQIMLYRYEHDGHAPVRAVLHLNQPCPSTYNRLSACLKISPDQGLHRMESWSSLFETARPCQGSLRAPCQCPCQAATAWLLAEPAQMSLYPRRLHALLQSCGHQDKFRDGASSGVQLRLQQPALWPSVLVKPMSAYHISLTALTSVFGGKDGGGGGGGGPCIHTHTHTHTHTAVHMCSDDQFSDVQSWKHH